MEYRILGKTGLKISRLGFGGIPIQRIDAEGTKALMHKLKDAGVNYIDTARGYTVSEEYLGYALEGIRDMLGGYTKDELIAILTETVTDLLHQKGLLL